MNASHSLLFKETIVDHVHCHINIIRKADQYILAKAVIAPAEESYFQRLTHMDKKNLDRTAFLSDIWVDPKVSKENLLPALLYLALRRARIWGKLNIATLLPNMQDPIGSLLKLQPIKNASLLKVASETLIPAAQMLEYAIYHTYQKCESEALTLIQAHFTDEILETVNLWIDSLFKTSWTQPIYDGTLTREQYLSMLYNFHSYVRFTTRLIGRAIGLSDAPDVRDHWINHLKGEINHERIIERDIHHLGGDVEYVKNIKVPNIPTKEFMIIQESTIAFYQDPVLFMACPLAAEGFTAHIQPDFMDALYKVIGSWGVAEPKEAARFLSSHIHTDGGDDGHWNLLVQIIKKHICSEMEVQHFLSVLHAAMNGFAHSLNSGAEECKLWCGVTPASVTTNLKAAQYDNTSAECLV